MIAVLGENIVDCVLQSDGQLKPLLGGSPLNVALALAKQQVPVCYLSPISRDHFGQAFVQLLQQHQVFLSPQQRSDKPSALALVSIDAHGSANYSLYRQGIADRDVTLEGLIATLPSDTTLLHTGSLALDPEDAAVVQPFIQYCRAQGIALSIDLNVRLHAISDAPSYRHYVQQLLPLANYIKASDEDLAALFPLLTLQDAIQHLRQLALDALLVLTAGAAGSTLYHGDTRLSVAAITPVPFVDTVGAGDTFFSNFLAALQPHLQLPPAGIASSVLQRALQRAAMAAALNIQHAGCVPPTQHELDQAMTALAAGQSSV
jgi:fructokinase